MPADILRTEQAEEQLQRFPAMGGVVSGDGSLTQFTEGIAPPAAASMQCADFAALDQPRKNRKQRRSERRGGKRR